MPEESAEAPKPSGDLTRANPPFAISGPAGGGARPRSVWTVVCAGRQSLAFFFRPVLYPNLYTWYVFASALDVLFTRFILNYPGGSEANALADWIIGRFGIPGLIVFKFISVAFVVSVCEFVGRHRHRTGLRLARWAVVLGMFPVVVGAFHLVRIMLAQHGYGLLAAGLEDGGP